MGPHMALVKQSGSSGKNGTKDTNSDAYLSSDVKPRVLFVDDSQLIRATAVKMFNGEFDLLLAEDGEEAWRIIVADPNIQVVFSDLVMPGLDGFELLERIRTSENPDIRNLPVIIATGADKTDSAKEKAFNLGATDFITKPFKATDIKARARSHADYRRNTKLLEKNTTIDPISGLLNKQGIQAQLERDLSYTQRHKENLTVMVVELDAFKDLFVRIGRKGAESVINKVSKVLLRTLRKEDSVSRIGLASFMVSLPACAPNNSLEMADRICQTVESFKARLNNVVIKITVSVGVCIVGEEQAATLDAVWNAAQDSHRKATELGRSQIYQLYLSEYLKDLKENAALELSIDELLRQLQKGEYEAVLPYLDRALEQMAPLLILLSNEQKQRIITFR